MFFSGQNLGKSQVEYFENRFRTRLIRNEV